MAHYSGAVSIPITSYTAWKNATLNNSYDLDGSYGAQCWDFCAEFWYNTGQFAYPYLSTGGTGAAYGCWTVESARTANAGTVFDLITDKTQLKTGDVIVMNAVSFNEYGHITFANEDYNGTNTISCFGQNQGGGTSVAAGGTTASVNNLGLDAFLGAFRYKPWHGASPTPVNPMPIFSTFVLYKNKFPWVLYAKKLRK